MRVLLNEDDQFLYGWIIEREPTPAEHDHTLMAKIREGAATLAGRINGYL